MDTRESSAHRSPQNAARAIISRPETASVIAAGAVDLVIDAANVVGSRPDGWWRDRAGATERLLLQLADLPGRLTSLHLGVEAVSVRIGVVHVVLEGLARSAVDPPSSASRIAVVRADRDGDSAVVDLVDQLIADRRAVLVVTADRGLRSRLPEEAACLGPRWLIEELLV